MLNFFCLNMGKKIQLNIGSGVLTACVSVKGNRKSKRFSSYLSVLTTVGLHMYLCTCAAITWEASTLTSLLYQNGRRRNIPNLFLFPIDFNLFISMHPYTCTSTRFARGFSLLCKGACSCSTVLVITYQKQQMRR